MFVQFISFGFYVLEIVIKYFKIQASILKNKFLEFMNLGYGLQS